MIGNDVTRNNRSRLWLSVFRGKMVAGKNQIVVDLYRFYGEGAAQPPRQTSRRAHDLGKFLNLSDADAAFDTVWRG